MKRIEDLQVLAGVHPYFVRRSEAIEARDAEVAAVRAESVREALEKMTAEERGAIADELLDKMEYHERLDFFNNRKVRGKNEPRVRVAERKR